MTIKISKVFIMWTLMSYPFRSSKSHRSKRHHHYDHYKTEDLLLRRQKGSEVRLDIMMQSEPTEKDEAKMLHKVDLDEMASKSCLNYSIFWMKWPVIPAFLILFALKMLNTYPCPFP